jgi:hypothetical protein
LSWNPFCLFAIIGTIGIIGIDITIAPNPHRDHEPHFTAWPRGRAVHFFNRMNSFVNVRPFSIRDITSLHTCVVRHSTLRFHNLIS